MTPMVNNAPSTIKGLVGRKMSKSVKFMGEDIKITKLSVAQIKQIQELVKAQKAVEDKQKASGVEASESDNEDGLELVKFVVRTSVEGGAELSDEDFLEFSMDDLTTLSNSIMEFSGMGQSGN